jgi:hypothetical protein
MHTRQRPASVLDLPSAMIFRQAWSFSLASYHAGGSVLVADQFSSLYTCQYLSTDS